MTLQERLTAFISLIRNLLIAADSNHAAECAAKDAAIAERDAVIEQLKAQLTEADTAIEAAIAEFTTPPATNPTPGADAIVKEADALPLENAPEVQEAVENTVGTSEPTSAEAVDAAVEMLVSEEATAPTEEVVETEEAVAE